MRGHAQFEALAGAVLLGEASAPEAQDFARHARACTACREDARGVAIVASLERVRDEETWRPAIDAAVLARIRERRTRRSRFTFSALTYGIVISIALNVLLVGGVGGPLMRVLRPAFEAPADVASQRLTIERRPHSRAPRLRSSGGGADVLAGLDIATTAPTVRRVPRTQPWPCATPLRTETAACIAWVSFP